MLRNKNIPIKFLILASLLALGLGTLVVILYINKTINQTAFLILLFIILLVFSSSTSNIFNHLITKKLNKKRRGRKYQLTKELRIDDAEHVETNYGYIDTLNISKTIYQLTVINNVDIFFSDENKTPDPTFNVKKISRSIQFYVFNNMTDKDNTKAAVLNYQAKNFYIASFIHDLEKNTLVQVDNVIENEEFKDYVDKMYSFIGIDREAH